MASQLDETTAQLHELKLKQRQLQARNHLLEKLAVLNKEETTQVVQQAPSQGTIQVHEFWFCVAGVIVHTGASGKLVGLGWDWLFSA